MGCALRRNEPYRNGGTTLKTHQSLVLALALFFGGSAAGCATLGEKAAIIGNGLVKAAGQVVSNVGVFTNLPFFYSQTHVFTNNREDCTLYVTTDGPYYYLQKYDPLVIGPGETKDLGLPNYSSHPTEASLLVEARDDEGNVLWAQGSSVTVHQGDNSIFNVIVDKTTF